MSTCWQEDGLEKIIGGSEPAASAKGALGSVWDPNVEETATVFPSLYWKGAQNLLTTAAKRNPFSTDYKYR